MRTHLALTALGMVAAASLPAATRPDDDPLVYITMHYASRAQ